jgi:hypothetical protein
MMDVQATGESSPQKRTSSTSTMKFLHYFPLLWVTFALLDQDPDPDSNADPDPADLNQSESGSTTLLISTGTVRYFHLPQKTGSGSSGHLSARGKEMRTDRWGGGGQTDRQDRQTRYRVAGRQAVRWCNADRR